MSRSLHPAHVARNRKSLVLLAAVGCLVVAAAVCVPPASASLGDWSIVDSPNSRPTPTNNFSFGVTCISAADCWAVGYDNSTVSVVQTLIEHWDGTSWAVVASPNTSPIQNNLLKSVACASPTECWAVGSYDNSGVQRTLVERWNGSSWAIVASPNAGSMQYNYLQGVACVPGNSDCWAVGFSSTAGGYQTLIEHWDGTTWTIVTSPSAGGSPESLLDGVACASASECWAVGDYINGTTGFSQTLIERWNGSAWAIATSPNALVSTDNDLDSVTCVSESECWAVGSYNGLIADQTLVERWDGVSWTVISSPNTLVTQNNRLHGVSCASESQCWAAGSYDSGSAAQTLIERWDGTSWTIVTSPSTSASQDHDLHGAACASAAADCWVVGTYATADGVDQSLLERWDGSSWVIVPSPSINGLQNNTLLGVTCAEGTDCWAVASYDNGSVQQTLIEHWDGTSWTIVASPNISPMQSHILYDVACPSTSECWAIGYARGSSAWQTLIERWDGTSWTIFPSPSTGAAQNNFLTDVTCLSASECWAVGYDDTGIAYQTLIEHWDGTSWSIVASPNTDAGQENRLFGVTCVSASECWAVGRYFNGTRLQTLIERWDGAAWTIAASPSTSATEENSLYGVTCATTTECWAVGSYGPGGGTGKSLIERWDGSSWVIVGSPNPAAPNDYTFLRNVTCTSTSKCWAVGFSFVDGAYRTLIERWDSTSWAIVSSPNTSAAQSNFLIGVTCASASDCWAAGYHYDDSGIIQTLVLRYTPAPGAGTVPDRSGPGSRTPLLITKATGGDLMLSWSPSCVSTDTDYVIYEGSMGGTFGNHESRFCSTAGATTKMLTPSSGSTYYLVAPRNAGREGSLGTRSDGSERSQGVTSCVPREIGTCPP